MYDIRVCGIPCRAEIIGYVNVGPWMGSVQNCPSSDDYYGYEDFDYEIYDRKGYRAEWLQKKITSAIDIEVRTMISEAIAKEKKEYHE